MGESACTLPFEVIIDSAIYEKLKITLSTAFGRVATGGFVESIHITTPKTFGSFGCILVRIRLKSFPASIRTKVIINAIPFEYKVRLIGIDGHFAHRI